MNNFSIIFLALGLVFSACQDRQTNPERSNMPQSNSTSEQTQSSDKALFEKIENILMQKYKAEFEPSFTPDSNRHIHYMKIRIRQHIKEIPIELRQFKHLSRVSIRGENLNSFPDLSHFPNLKSLSIWHGNFRDTTFIPPCNLEYLALVDCNIQTIIFSEKSKIKTLHLWGNKIEQIHPSMYKINNLEDLSLIDNPFSNIEIEKFKHLKKLGLSDNQSDCKEIQAQFPDLDFSCTKYDNSERPWRGPFFD